MRVLVLQAAAEEALEYMKNRVGGTGGAIVLDRRAFFQNYLTREKNKTKYLAGDSLPLQYFRNVYDE
jgi:hypothetical protein